MSKNNSIRSFLAIEVSPEVRSHLADCQNAIRPILKDVRASWVNPSNIHLTLKFLGDLSQETIASIAKINQAGVPSFDLTLGEIGFFPNVRRPRVVWCGYAGSPELKLLVDRLEVQMEKLGFKREMRPFKAHLTLGRFREQLHLTDELIELLGAESQKFAKPISHRVDRVVLFKSTLSSAGSIYSPMHSFLLGEL